MDTCGFQRVIGSTDSFEGLIDSEITRNNLSDTNAMDQNEFVERLNETSSTHANFVICAPHGGKIEIHTDEQAEHVYARLSAARKEVSCWRCKGWNKDGNPSDRWHITSTEISTNSFKLLGQIKDRKFAYGVSFHGKTEDGITIGGRGPCDIKCSLRQAILSIPGLQVAIHIADPKDRYSGDDKNNFINWITAGGNGGIQIEQSPEARRNHWQDIADAVASVLEDLT